MTSHTWSTNATSGISAGVPAPGLLLELFAAELSLFSAIDAIYRRAADRGEIDPERVTGRMKTLPFDLLRAQLLMTLRPMGGC
jgi:hypothetical protein